jgi:ABC-2 type transport system permease protein
MLAWRVPLGLIWGFAFPVLLLLVFAVVPAFRRPDPELGGATLLTVYVPVIICFVLAMLAFVGLTTPLAGYREQGVLRRLSTTPAPPSWVLAAQLVINFAFAVGAVILIMVIAIVGFGVHAPEQVGGFILSFLLTAAALFAIGLVIAAIAPSAGVAGAIGTILFFPLMFFAGLWIPRPVMPEILREIGDYTPLGAATSAMQDAMQGAFPSTTALLVLAGYAVVFGLASVKLFRWE